MIVKDKYKSCGLGPGEIWKNKYYVVVGIASNNGTIKVKDINGRIVCRHLLGVEIVKA